MEEKKPPDDPFRSSSSQHRSPKSKQLQLGDLEVGNRVEQVMQFDSQTSTPHLATPTDDVMDFTSGTAFQFDAPLISNSGTKKRPRISDGAPFDPQFKAIQEQNAYIISKLKTYLLKKTIATNAIEYIMKAVSFLEKNCDELIVENATLVGEINALKGSPRQVSTPVQGLDLENLKNMIVTTVADEIKKLQDVPREETVPTYSKKLKQAVPKPEGTVFISATAQSQERFPTTDALKKTLKESITPANEGIRVCNVVQTTKGVLIQTRTKEGARKIAENPKIKELGVEAKIPKKRLPRVIIYDIPSDMPETEIVENFWKQNALGIRKEKQTFKPIFKNGPKNKETVNWIAEVSPAVYAEVLAEGRVFLDFASCNAREWISLTRCNKCQAFGHIARDCSAKDDNCSYCGEKGHRFEDCQVQKASGPPKCYNCERAKQKSDHPATYRNCPAYLRGVERLRDQTLYQDDGL